MEINLGDTSVYTKFGHLLDALMGRNSKALMDELSRDIVAHTIGFGEIERYRTFRCYWSF